MTEKEKEQPIEATQIATETEVGFKLPDGSVVNKDGLLLWIAQRVHKIEKAVA